MKYNQYRKASLVLEDGQVFEGFSFGHEQAVSGEIVFNTAMTGYPESLTDPSYCGQIIVLTYPSIGNYGVPGKTIEHQMLRFFESDRIHAKALIIADYSAKFNHWNAEKSLGEWLREEQVPGLFGIDTRMLTKIIREKGTMLAKIVFSEDIPFENPDDHHLVDQVSLHERIVYGHGKHRILLIDCGVKSNIIRYLLGFDTTIIRVPWNYDYSHESFDGLFISNGPGDPVACQTTVANLKKSLQQKHPIFGICLGHQLLALAAGAETYKLKFGHRSHNQPVIRQGSTSAYLTSQNHGYAVKSDSIPVGWEPYFTNLNDNSNEGLIHTEKPWFSTQFHPEASSGPTDTAFLFDKFINSIETCKK
ncbi:MAG: glutamine-hydrolyzing carbamoyl-phosphate synthase small subunit [Bacteroidales bacterium]|nr:glutamine-hydrolyzing carbamoyl-phosphate synthase small subunit [Bacteroidales bacterium]